MEIKQIINSKVNSFVFSKDISSGDFLKEILKLFHIEEVYVCFYSYKCLPLEMLETISAYKLWEIKIPTKEYQESLIVKIIPENFNLLIKQLSEFEYNELIVWNCYTDWENFCKDLTRYSTTSVSNTQSFYLDYNIYDGKKCEIICDIGLNEAVKNITKKQLIDILT